MHCTRIRLPNGMTAIVCGARPKPKPCGTCGYPAAYQCDWKIAPRKTCDRHICAAHALEVAPDKHLCPEHQQAYRAWRASRAARG